MIERGSVTVFGDEGNRVIVDIDDAVVRDGDTMSVTTQILDEESGSLKRGLRIDVPLFPIERVFELGKRVVMSEIFAPPFQGQLLILVELFDGRHYLPTKEF